MSAAAVIRIDDWEIGNHELDERFLTAMAEKDVDAAMSCFIDSPELVAVIWGNEYRGPTQLKEAMTTLFEQYDEIALIIDRVHEFRSGDSVIAVGQATYTLRKGEVQSKLSEIWSDVRRKVNGRWVYVLDHAEVLWK